MQTLIRTVAPSTAPISIEEAKSHLYIMHSDDDDMIEHFIESSTRYFDGRDGVLGSALITQTWKLTIDRFDDAIDLPLPPLQSVTSITYLDAAGATQTLSPSRYRVIGVGSMSGGHVIPAYNDDWPTIRGDLQSIDVTFVAGYGSAPADVPEPIRQAIRDHVMHMYENRDGQPAPRAIVDAVAGFRHYAF